MRPKETVSSVKALIAMSVKQCRIQIVNEVMGRKANLPFSFIMPCCDLYRCRRVLPLQLLFLIPEKIIDRCTPCCAAVHFPHFDF